MVFNSFAFLLFFSCVFGLYLFLDRTWQNRLLLGAGYFFYGWWDWRFALLLLFSTTCDYFLAVSIDRTEEVGRRKTWLVFSVLINLTILGFFKYFNFFAEGAASLLNNLGFHASLPALNVVLPVGVSFYTFQSMSYIIDVYRRELPANRKFVDYAAFVAFFPQLVAGPIERATHLLSQFSVDRKITWDQTRHGATLFAWGLFKKVFIADNCSGLADTIFNGGDHSGLETLIGVYAFTFQIYADFSGYSDMARGLAHMLGFRLMRNFNLPYFSTNPSDFWRRWHISLSTWLRDYLYISLGGNRGGPVKTQRNLFLTMTIGGLWHGASWHFVLWGMYHGLLLILHRLLTPVLSLLRIDGWLPSMLWFWIRVILFFQCICVGWILFRADTATQAWNMLTTIATDLNPNSAAWEMAVRLLGFTWPLLIVQLWQWKLKNLNFFLHLSPPVKAVFVAIALYLLSVHGTSTDSFIYFQF